MLLGVKITSSLLYIIFIATNQLSIYAQRSCGEKCFGEYCRGSHIGTTCIDGYCRCPNNPSRDYCTCLSTIGGCHIMRDNSTALGVPTYQGQSQTTYSCVTNNDNVNCIYDIHVISNYAGNSQYGIGSQQITEGTDVHLTVSGPNEGAKPLILVFVSHSPVNWILSIPSGVVIERVLLGSYYIDDSSVTGFSSQSVVNIEKHSYQTLPHGYGLDTIEGNNTMELLEYLIGRFGCIVSFTGSYRADTWRLNIQRCLIQSAWHDCQQPTSHSTDPTSTHENSEVIVRISLVSVSAMLIVMIILTVCLIGFVQAYIIRKHYRVTSSQQINSSRSLTQRATTNTHASATYTRQTFDLHQQPPIHCYGTSTFTSTSSDDNKSVIPLKDSSLQDAPPPAYPATGYMLATDDSQSINVSKEAQSGSTEYTPPSYESVIENDAASYPR